jgi:hypothetical protein
MPNAHPRPWHRGSLFCDGPRVPMCRERRAVWRARLNLYRRARRITPLFEDIGLAMLHRLGTDGRLDPSHETIADDVGCDPRTVRRALAAFKACGLVVWVQRLVREGWRVLQTSNAYALTIGEPPAIPGPRTGGQIVRGTLNQAFSTLQAPVLTASEAERRAAQTGLNRTAQRRQAERDAAWLASRAR